MLTMLAGGALFAFGTRQRSGFGRALQGFGAVMVARGAANRRFLGAADRIEKLKEKMPVATVQGRQVA